MRRMIRRHCKKLREMTRMLRRIERRVPRRVVTGIRFNTRHSMGSRKLSVLKNTVLLLFLVPTKNSPSKTH